MGHDKEIKRVGLADFCKGLKASQGILIVLKILRKLVPHEENSGDVVLVNDAFAPLPELMDRKKRDIMERKGDKEDENKRQKQQKESSAAAL